MKKFPWDCNDCPMLHTYDMSIDDLTHICWWSKEQIDDCDRYQSAECPLEKHDSELLDKVADRIKSEMIEDYPINVNGVKAPTPFAHFSYRGMNEILDKVIENMKAEVADNDSSTVNP